MVIGIVGAGKVRFQWAIDWRRWKILMSQVKEFTKNGIT